VPDLPDTAARLAAVGESDLTRLGFRAEDRRDLLDVIERLSSDPDAAAEVDRLAHRLRAAVGDFSGSGGNPFEGRAAEDTGWGIGVLPMLALVATAEDVTDFHRSRGVEEQISIASLSDIGQQAWVHRRTYGDFGLHTYGWLRIAWSGALYWLGRLQFNLTEFDGDWVLSTHIPESGPLTPEAVAESFGRARGFFARHFADYPTRLFHCHSWLLDPQLVEVLRPDSNMSRFQQLWQLRPTQGDGNGDGDALFFVFRKRGDVDPASLPQTTTLERAIVSHLTAGGHWYCRTGTLDQDRFPVVDEPAAARDAAGAQR
jgi:hypothetical protein